MTDASTLLLVITRTEFISALVITNECLQHLSGLTTSLQDEAKDIVQAVSEIKTLTHPSSKSERMLTPTTVGGLKQSRKCVMRWGLHINAQDMWSHHRASIPASNLSEYFRRTITVPILDSSFCA